MKVEIPSNIKKMFKINFIFMLVIFIFGIILKRVELYLGYTLGVLGAMIVMYMLTREIYTMVYIKEKNIRDPFGYVKRLGVVICILLVVSYISKKYYVNNISGNIIATGIGLMSFKIIIFFEKKFTKNNDKISKN